MCNVAGYNCNIPHIYIIPYVYSEVDDRQNIPYPSDMDAYAGMIKSKTSQQ